MGSAAVEQGRDECTVVMESDEGFEPPDARVAAVERRDALTVALHGAEPENGYVQGLAAPAEAEDPGRLHRVVRS
ncbi:predicted protein [Streptomyces sp. SPB78]|nr:predicted protein [Streptomyces sp. SPB78]